jgi:acyl-[acyl-carrier-protein] desaturase
VERTIHRLIANGFNPNTTADPYNLLIYTSFQERADAHLAQQRRRIAAKTGDLNLARICGVIAATKRGTKRFTRA